MKSITIHSDGACLGNPGAGGWAAVLEYGSAKKELVGGDIATTNNRMELQAAIQALKQLKEPCNVDLFTDSEYLRQGIATWIHVWKSRGWKKTKNKDLWLELDAAASKHEINWHWVRGHAGDPNNERCDFLATQEAQRFEDSHTPEQLSQALAVFQNRQQSVRDQPELMEKLQ